MSFFPTLNLTKTVTALLGNIQVQPKPSVTPKPTSTSTWGPINVLQTTLAKVVGLISSPTSTTLTKITQPTPPSLISPSVRIAVATVNRIVPSYLIAPHKPASDVLPLSTKVFEPYEQLTGISHERPEIVALLPFKPLYSDDTGQNKSSTADIYQTAGIDPYLTDEGLYADSHIQAKNLIALSSLSAVRSILLRYPAISGTYSTREAQFQQNISALNDITKFLLGLITRTDSFKNQLDLRDDIFKVNSQDSARIYSLNVANSTTYFLADTLASFAKRYLPPSFAFTDVLVRLGYPSTASSTLYSSTKLWTQLAIEYKQILRFHSLEFLDLEPSLQRNDNNASTFTKIPESNLFGFASKDVPGLPPLSTLVSLKPIDLKTFLPIITRGFQSIYSSGAHFKSDEAKIAALAHLISKEQKYSLALVQSDVRQILTKYFQYAISDTERGNLPVFDAVIGQFGQSIMDIATTQKLSLAGIAQQQLQVTPVTDSQQTVSVLTFESKYLEGTNGDLTPGSSYYVDSVFQTTGQSFNTANLSDLSTLLSDASTALSVVVNGMNVLGVVDTNQLNQNKGNIGTFIADPATLMTYIYKSFLDKNGDTLSTIKNDRLCGVYVLAATNPTIKTALFQFTMNRIFRANFNVSLGNVSAAPSSGDNTATNDSLVTMILDTLLATTQETRLILQTLAQKNAFAHDANNIDQDTIKSSFKNGTNLTRVMEDILSQIYTTIAVGTTTNGRMHYSGVPNTVVMMAAFDMLITMIAKFGDQKIVSRKLGGSTISGKITYTVSKTPANHLNSANDIRTRLNREQTLVQQITYCFLNALQQLSANATGLKNYLSSPNATTNLQAITKTIGDPSLVQMLLSEQQIMLLGSTVADLSTRFNGSTTSNTTTPTSTGTDNNFGSDEIKILDDSIITPNLRNAFFGTFHSPEYSGARASNKRIISVGIPLGFTRRIKQVVKKAELKNTSFEAKQHDIIQVVVYKVDLINQDIVYKPVRFLFELSRFPVYNAAYYKQLSANPSFAEITNAIPTRDFEQAYESGGGQSVSYWSSTRSSSTAVKNAMDSPSYSFLLPNVKASIIKNHITSQMLEVYTKLMTGISLGEANFDIVTPPSMTEDDFVKTLTDHSIQNAINFSQFNVASAPPVANSSPISPIKPSLLSPPHKSSVGGVLFSSTVRVTLPAFTNSFNRVKTSLSGISGDIGHITQAQSISNPVSINKSPPSLRSPVASLQSIAHRQIPAVIQVLKSVSSITNTQTSISDGIAVSKRILSPKQFDRVFNVIIDPDEFEFDFVKTTATENGTLALQQMISRGEIVPADPAMVPGTFITNLPIDTQLSQIIARPTYAGRPDPNLNNFRFRDRNRVEGDVMFEKYFVTIETYGSEES